MTAESLIVVADTSVLINFLKLDRMDLIARHSSKFLITNHVRTEVLGQHQRLIDALESEILEEHAVNTDNQEDWALFGKLCAELGTGESSAITFALNRGYALAIDDGKAIKIAKKISKSLEIFRTQDVFQSMIQQNLIDIQEADRLKHELETMHKFKMSFQSFSDLLS